MMTIEAWLAFAATVSALLLLPHPLAFSVATYARSWGRRSAFVTVPAAMVAIVLTAILSTAAVVGLLAIMPALDDAASWLGLCFLMIYALYSFQDPRLRQGIADNDNLPETRPLRVFGHFIRVTFRSGRYVFLIAAILAQFANPGVVQQVFYPTTIAVIAACAFASTLAYALFPQLSTWKRRRSAPSGKASHKPKTLYIARRAVTAGYRRIAA
jgi:threonine/homoserine/homoserine lactone efflux protein